MLINHNPFKSVVATFYMACFEQINSENLGMSPPSGVILLAMLAGGFWELWLGKGNFSRLSRPTSQNSGFLLSFSEVMMQAGGA